MRSHRGPSIAEAARMLEITEHAMRAHVAAGSVRVVGKGSYGRMLLDVQDVRSLARQRELGELGRRMRLVLVVGDLPDAQQALRVAGMTPERATDVLDALSRHDVPGAPIIVASPEVVNAELAILAPTLGQIHLAVVAHTQTAVPWSVEQYASVIDPLEPRRLVQWAYASLDARTKAGALKL